jgi:hypothetical protein
MEQQINQPGQPSQFNYPQMNPINPPPASPVPAQKNKSCALPLIISVVLAVVIVGGGMYWRSSQKEAELNIEISGFQTQVGQLNSQLSAQAAAAEKLNDNLAETKFKLKILSSLGISDVLRDSRDKNKFYYVRPAGSDVSEVMVYDLTKDSGYKQTGDFNIAAGSSLLFSEKVGKSQEFRGVGVLDNKFIFAKTAENYSLPACSSLWLYPVLNYIDLSASSSIKQSYVLPDELKNSEIKKEQECQSSLK